MKKKDVFLFQITGVNSLYSPKYDLFLSDLVVSDEEFAISIANDALGELMSYEDNINHAIVVVDACYHGSNYKRQIVFKKVADNSFAREVTVSVRRLYVRYPE